MIASDAAASPADDPEPQPPPELDLDACCGSGCDPCVLDLYEEARQRYLTALRAWRERHAPPCARAPEGEPQPHD